MEHRTKLTVAYLGAGFSGWQLQGDVRTVQGALEDALARLVGGRRVAVVGAGRTDAGVHARAQTAHLDLPVAIPATVLPQVLNSGLAADLRVRKAVSVPSSFHARKCALGKHYAYRIRWREPDLPWQGLRTAVAPPPVELRALKDACIRLVGRRDWASFTVPEVAHRSTVRTVFRIEPVEGRDGMAFHFFGEGFLRYQVRRMIGALLEVGRGRMNVAELEHLLDRPSPGAPLPTAPARGLTLERVYYRSSPKIAS
jgi:tRNA pseudouridine38-40 synthase